MKRAGGAVRPIAAQILILALIAGPAAGQDAPVSRTLLLRATVEVSAPADEFIARNARDIQLTSEMRRGLEIYTPEQIAEELCGGVRPGYLGALLAGNAEQGIALVRGAPLGAVAAVGVRVPSCLYWTQTPSTRLRSQSGALPDRETLTGARAGGLNPVRLLASAWLRVTGRDRSDASSAVAIRPVSMDAETFMAALEDAAGGEGRVIIETDRRGRIVTSTDPGACVANGPAYDPAELVRVYAFATRRARERNAVLGHVSVIIADNGFYGVRPDTTSAEAWSGSPFPAYLFRRSSNGSLERALAPGRGFPVREGVPNDTSGHGTHVAGLAVGGPELLLADPDVFDRDTLFDADHDGQAWLHLTILNVARDDDSRLLPETALSDLNTALNFSAGPRIINMSFAYEGADQLTAIDTLLGQAIGRRDLFIVAAGNDGVNVADGPTLPAARGGLVRNDVITVAAHDGHFGLADFSNFGSLNVDLAAPGCLRASWLGRDVATTPMSGTSMATPSVTFSAALLASLDSNASPQILKRRIVLGGDLLRGSRAGLVTFRVGLNPLRSLVSMSDDVIELVGDRPGVFYLGEVRDIRGAMCGGASAPGPSIWSLKRERDVVWLYRGRSDLTLASPCEGAFGASGRIRFSANWRIAPGAAPEQLSGAVETYAPAQIASLTRREP